VVVEGRKTGNSTRAVRRREVEGIIFICMDGGEKLRSRRERRSGIGLVEMRLWRWFAISRDLGAAHFLEVVMFCLNFEALTHEAFQQQGIVSSEKCF
jgi:hypothetical protein